MNTRASNQYLPALDGFRAVSIGLVLLSHAGLQQVVPGGLGVMVFFVISGFLLTRQMIVEIERSGTLSIKRFYFRRFLRLAPALVFYIALMSCFLLYEGIAVRPVHVASGLFYFANYYDIFFGYPADNPFPILWSLAVEEHYYIVFPFIVWAFRRYLKCLMPWLCAAVIGVLAWRWQLLHLCSETSPPGVCGIFTRERIFHGTDTIFDSILYGALMALALHYGERFARRIINLPAFAAALLLLLFTLIFRNAEFRETLRFSLQSIAVAVIIVNVLFGAQKPMRCCQALLSLPIVTWMGRLAYSLYLFHFGMIVAIDVFWHVEPSMHNPAALVLYWIGAFALAAMSYYLIEKPVARYRRRFGSHNHDTAKETP